MFKQKKERQQSKEDSLNNAIRHPKKGIENTYPKLANFTQDNFKIKDFQKNIRPKEVVLNPFKTIVIKKTRL